MRNFICLLALLSYFGVYSQNDSDSFFADGKYWVCEEYNPWLEKTRLFTVSVGKTVEVDGVKVKEILREPDENQSGGPYGYGHEENGKIYLLTELFGDREYKFWPLMDFCSQAGDKIVRSFPIIGPDEFDVKDEGQIIINGISCRILTLYDSSMEETFYWIYGVGTEFVYSYLSEKDIVLECPTDDIEAQEDRFWHFSRMTECYQNDKLIYSHDILEQYLAEKGDNLAGIVEIGAEIGFIKGDEPLYDLMGRKVAAPQPGQIYVSPSGKRLYR